MKAGSSVRAPAPAPARAEMAPEETTFEISTSPPDGWDDFVAAEARYFFTTTRWGEVVRVGFDNEVLYCTLTGDGGRIRLGMMGAQRKTLGFRMLHSFFPYGGLIGDLDLSRRFFDALLPALRERGYHMLVVEDRVMLLPESVVPDPTYGIRHIRMFDGPLTEDELFRSYGQKSIRRNVRKARDAGLEVTTAATEADVEEIYELYRASMVRNSAPTWYKQELFLEIFRRLQPTGDASFPIVRVNGRIAGMMSLVYSEGGTHYWMGGSSPEGQRLKVNDLLIHTEILRCIERGDAFFDAMGTRTEDHALAAFKEKWGALPEPVLGYKIDLAPLRARLFRRAYRLARTGPGAWLVRRFHR